MTAPVRTDLAYHPPWLLLVRDVILFIVGIGGIIFEHLQDSPNLGLMIVDLVLIGLVPVGHVLGAIRNRIDPDART